MLFQKMHELNLIQFNQQISQKHTEKRLLTFWTSGAKIFHETECSTYPNG